MPTNGHNGHSARGGYFLETDLAYGATATSPPWPDARRGVALRPLRIFGDDQFADFEKAGGLHAILNSAGLVSFAPSLESALRINAMGAKNVLDAARKAGARLCHVSTCYVAGRRDGDVWEDAPIVGYFPRRDDLLDRDFDPAAEIADCQKMIDQARERSNDRQHISQFREKGA